MPEQNKGVPLKWTLPLVRLFLDKVLLSRVCLRFTEQKHYNTENKKGKKEKIKKLNRLFVESSSDDSLKIDENRKNP